MKITIGENVLNLFVETTKEFKKLDELYDAGERNNMKKISLKAGSKMVLMRRLDKIKYGELIHDFSIQYAIVTVINNGEYPKTIQ